MAGLSQLPSHGAAGSDRPLLLLCTVCTVLRLHCASSGALGCTRWVAWIADCSI